MAVTGGMQGTGHILCLHTLDAQMCNDYVTMWRGCTHVHVHVHDRNTGIDPHL